MIQAMKREEQIYKAAEKATNQKPPQYSELVHKSRKVMSAYEVGFIDGCVWADSHPNGISVEDWEQRRYEIAKDIMANKCLEQLADAAAMDFDVHDKEQVQADIAVSLADALVDRLKKR